MVNDVMSRMKIVREGIDCIEDVRIYFEDIGIAISIQDGYESLAIEEYQVLSGSLDERSEPLLFREDTIYMLVRHPALKSKKGSGYLVEVLSKKNYFQKFWQRELKTVAMCFCLITRTADFYIGRGRTWKRWRRRLPRTRKKAFA